MKRLLSIFLVGALLLGVLTAAPFMVSAAWEGNFEYAVSGGKATVTLYNGPGGDVTIPSRLGGYPVTAIDGFAFWICKDLTGVNIPYGVTEIRDNSFIFCSNLKTVKIPNSVTSIGNSAFSHCTSLKSIEIPESVEIIGIGAFSGCESLTDIYCAVPEKPDGWDDWWASACNATVHWANGDSDDTGEPDEPKMPEVPEEPEEPEEEPDPLDVYTTPSPLTGVKVAPKKSTVSTKWITWSFPTIDGKTVTEHTYADKTVLLVFYRASMSGGKGICSNSNSLISDLASCNWIGTDDVQVIAMDVDGNTKADIQAYKATYAPDCDDILFTYGRSNWLMWNVIQLAQGDGIDFVTLTVCAVIKDGALCYNWTGCADAEDCRIALSQVSSVPEPSARGSYRQAEARSILARINALRTGRDAWYWNEEDTNKIAVNGLGELTYDYALEQIAMRRAMEQALYYSHFRPNGANYTSISYNGVVSVRECLAANSPTSAETAFAFWAAEDESYVFQRNRRNMLDRDLTSVGIACFYYEGRYFWAMEFGYTNSGINDPYPGLSTPPGDLNGNGEVDAADYMLLKRHCLGTFTLTEEQIFAADVNYDGDIDTQDYMLVKRHVLGTYKIS